MIFSPEICPLGTEITLLSTVQAHLLHRAGDPAGLHIVPRLEGLGYQHLDAPRQVGERTLDGQGHRQADDTHQRHQAGHGHADIAQHNAHGNQPQHHAQGGVEEGAQPPLQLQPPEGAIQQPENDFHDNQAGHNQQPNGEQCPEIQIVEKAAQGFQGLLGLLRIHLCQIGQQHSIPFFPPYSIIAVWMGQALFQVAAPGKWPHRGKRKSPPDGGDFPRE